MTAYNMADGKWQTADGARKINYLQSSIYLLPFAILLAVSGCKSPFDRTRDASGGGGTGSLSGTSNLVIFSDELKTGGGSFQFPGGQNQDQTFADTSNPVSHRSIRYSWNGQPTVVGTTNATFAGFDLMHVVDNTPTLTIYATTPGRDLRLSGYTKATFYVRGSLSSHTRLKIEVSDDGNPNTPAPCLTLSTSGTEEVCEDNGPNLLKMPPLPLTDSWQQRSVTIPNSALANVKDFIKFTFVFDPTFGAPSGQGGAIFIDQIQYEH